MLQGVNDSTDQAHELVKTLKGTPSKVNLIRLTHSRVMSMAVRATTESTASLKYYKQRVSPVLFAVPVVMILTQLVVN